MRKSWWVFHDKLLIGRCFWGFVLPVLEYCSAVWCSAADTHIKLLDRVVSGACFRAGGVLTVIFPIVDRWQCFVCCTRSGVTRSTHFVTVLLTVCALCASPGTRGALIPHRHTFAPPRCRTSQYRRTFIPLSVSLWNELVTPYLMEWDWRVSRAGPMPICWPSCSLLFCLQLFSLSLLFLYRLVVWG